MWWSRSEVKTNGLIQKTTSQDFAIFSDLEFFKNDSFFTTRCVFLCSTKNLHKPNGAVVEGAESMLMFSPNELSQSIILRHYGRWHEMEVALTNKNHFQSGRIWKFLFWFIFFVMWERWKLEDVFLVKLNFEEEKFEIWMLLKGEHISSNGWWCKSLAASHLRTAKIVCIWWMPLECLDLEKCRGYFYMINIFVGVHFHFLSFLLRWRIPNEEYELDPTKTLKHLILGIQ